VHASSKTTATDSVAVQLESRRRLLANGGRAGPGGGRSRSPSKGLPRPRPGRILRRVSAWIAAIVPVALGAGLAGGLRVRRFSPGHITARLTVAGRGLYFSRTPDGDWWALRLRRRCRAASPPPGPADAPPDIGVREPRRPPGPGPVAGAARLDLP
jgi:hypothetical protein